MFGYYHWEGQSWNSEKGQIQKKKRLLNTNQGQTTGSPKISHNKGFTTIASGYLSSFILGSDGCTSWPAHLDFDDRLLLILWPCPKHFRFFQLKRFCRRQFQISGKWQKVLQKNRKYCGKRRNCLLWAISPFPTVFSRELYCRHIKIRVCLGKG